MGIWSFKGGQIFTNDGQFKENTVKDIEVKNADSREIFLEDDDLLLPGLIDMNVTLWGVDGNKNDCLPTEVLLATGVIGCVDNGTYGYERWLSADRIWRYGTAQTRSWINLVPQYGIVEPKQKTSARFIDCEKSVAFYEKVKDRALGFKVILGGFAKQKDLDWLKLARKIADKANCRLMVQLAGATASLDEILDYVRPNDVLTAVYHCFPGASILDDNDRINEKLIRAVKQGILLDTGAAEKYLSFHVYQKAAAAGLYPNFISTGMGKIAWREAPTYDMSHMVSKFIALGMDKTQAFRAAITTPAQYCGFVVDNEKDLLVLKTKRGNIVYEDNRYGFVTDDLHNTIIGDLEYTVDIFIRNNKLAFDLKL